MNLNPDTAKQSIFEFPQLKKIIPAKIELPPIKVNGAAKISGQVKDFGIQVNINKKIFRLKYPTGIWNRFPKTHRGILAENIAFSQTFHLPYIFKSLKKMIYNIPVPLSEAFFFKSYSLSLPITAMMNDYREEKLTSNLLRRLFEVDYIYNNKKTEIPPYNRTSLSDQAIMPFTFGKDSLLTFALCRELGFKVHPVYIMEPEFQYEALLKKLLSIQFRKEYRVKIYFLNNTLGKLKEVGGWHGWELQLTQYSLMLLPYVYSKKAGYIFFSNEQSCNDTIIDEEGFRCNPVFEQSHSWLLQNSLMTSIVGGNSLSIGSVLEPLYELAIMKILHKRYPEIGKYQSSCDLENRPRSGGRWCEDCSKCARIFIFLLALGINPKKVGFKYNLMSRKYRVLFPIFKTNTTKAYGYDQSGAGNDEQIFSFYLAYNRGIKGPLMTKFVRKYLKYARKNEKNFRKKFFGIHSTKTVPGAIKARLLRIYRQELENLS